MAYCDLCKKETKFSELEELRDSFKIKNVDAICKDCNRWITDRKFDMRYVRRQMIIRRNRTDKGTWLSRLYERIKYGIRTET